MQRALSMTGSSKSMIGSSMRGSKAEQDGEKGDSAADLLAELRRLADAIEKEELLEIQVVCRRGPFASMAEGPYQQGPAYPRYSEAVFLSG